MRIRGFAAVAALGLVALGGNASADEVKGEVKGEVKTTGPSTLVFGDGVARFNVISDRSAGTMTFRLADDAKIRLTDAPVVTITTTEGPKQVTLTRVEGQTNVWRLSHPVIREERFDGRMRILVDGKSYESALFPSGVSIAPRYGGRVIAFDTLGHAEVVHDPATGMVTFYTIEHDGRTIEIVEPPSIIVGGATPRTIAFTRVDGKTAAWRVSDPSFKVASVPDARLRILVDGKPYETNWVTTTTTTTTTATPRFGGRIVTVDNGPSWEIVRDQKAGYWTFYPGEYQGRVVEFQEPPVVVLNSPEGAREVRLVRVEGEPAWRLPNASEILDGRLKFTLFGKTLEAGLGTGGAGIGIR